MEAIKTVHLSKAYDTVEVLHQLNLSIQQGEVYGFIGKNGAGKTTTINLILSLISRNSGDIYVMDEFIKPHAQHYKKSIGYVPDVPAFPGYMMAKEYLSFVCDIFQIPQKEQQTRINEVLEFVSLPNSKKRISAYSRGMKQRLAIAQALIHDPDILIMDEPTSALDPIGRKDVMNIILKLKGSKTIFYSTHILDDVEKVCDRIGILDEGTLLVEDSIQNIKEKYYHQKLYIETKTAPKELASKLIELALIQDVAVDGFGVVCKLSDNVTNNALLEALLKLDETVVEFRKVETKLEDIFISLTNENTN